MAIDPNSNAFIIIEILFVILALSKLMLALYLWGKIRAKRQEGGPGGSEFVGKVMIMFFGLFLARLSYILFDFYFTKFDSSLYILEPNIWFWKVGSLITGLGTIPLLYFLDKKILNFKLKGIPVIILATGLAFMFVYPVKNASDFQLVSGVQIISSLGLLLVPIIFVYIASKTSGEVRKMAILMVVGIVIYAILGALVNEGLLAPLKAVYGDWIQILAYILSTAGKIGGLGLFAWASSKFQL